MKKISTVLLTFMCVLLIGTKVHAADVTGYVPHKIIVKFENDFSTKNPPQTFSVALTKECLVKNTRTVEQGTILYIELTKINKEKVGKLNASAVGRIVKVYVPSQDKTVDVNSINPNAYVKFSQYEKLDVTDKAVDVGISVANVFVKNVTYPAHFVKGVVKNETGNRLRSGAKETFDSSVFSYATLGQPFVVKKGDLATLTYYTKDMGAKVSETSNEVNE